MLLEKGLSLVPAGGLLVVTGVYTFLMVLVDQSAPQCVDPDICLEGAVNNATSTLVSGFLAVLFILMFSYDLWNKNRFEEDIDDKDSQGSFFVQYTIFVSPIKGLIALAIGILFQFIARAAQPDISVGNAAFWIIWSSSFVALLVSNLFFAKFADEVKNNDKSAGSLVSPYLCCSQIGANILLLMLATTVVLMAGISCAIPNNDDDLSNSTNSSTDILSLLGNGTRRLEDLAAKLAMGSLDEVLGGNETNATGSDGGKFQMQLGTLEVADREEICQDIGYYGVYVFYIANFLFWGTLSDKFSTLTVVLQEEMGESRKLAALGLPSRAAVFLLQFTLFTMIMYPVWIFIAAEVEDFNTVELAVFTKEQIVYNFGLIILALVMHNLASSLKFEDEIPRDGNEEKDEVGEETEESDDGEDGTKNKKKSKKKKTKSKKKKSKDKKKSKKKKEESDEEESGDEESGEEEGGEEESDEEESEEEDGDEGGSDEEEESDEEAPSKKKKTKAKKKKNKKKKKSKDDSDSDDE